MTPIRLSKPPRFIFYILLILWGLPGYSQIRIDTSLSAAQLVKEVLLGEGIVVGNVRFTGPKYAVSRFRDSTKILSIHEGILLTSGNTFIAQGPNKHAGAGWVSQDKGFARLDTLANGRTHDAAILEFDFVTAAEALTFNFIFASEEYPEYVDSKYNDVFGFFISGPGLPGVNLATLPRSKVPVSINSINHKTNKKYFVSNPTHTYNDPVIYDVRLKKTIKNKNFGKEGGLPKYNIQYDGFTTVLEAVCRVIPGEVYHIQLAIADAGDYSLDSGVFLEAHSFRSTGGSYVSIQNPFPTPGLPVDILNPAVVPDPPSSGNTIEPPVADELPPSGKTAAPVCTVEFPFDAYHLTDSAQSQLLELARWLVTHPEATVELTGHTDSMGTDQYNEQLSRNRARSVALFLADQGIKTNVTCTYRGEKEPLAPNDSDSGRARNRRTTITITVTPTKRGQM